MDPTSPEWRRLLATGAASFDVVLSDHQADLFARFAVELLHWNRRMNLTTITDPLQILSKHFLDSLVPMSFLPPKARLLDIGSGGGFPGIPLKIANPQLDVRLVDASRKKVSFQKHVIRSLNLTGIDGEQYRLEADSRTVLSPKGFDVVVSRAFADLPAVVERAWPQLAPAGLVIAWRGRPDPAQENRAVALMAGAGWQCSVEQVPYRLPKVTAERHLVVLKVRRNSAARRNEP
jgi:16S rRNA (guanine527-N7)-methyltransferase